MTTAVRRYHSADWGALCRIHDAARLDELRDSVGLDAFLRLADTFDAEDLFGNPSGSPSWTARSPALSLLRQPRSRGSTSIPRFTVEEWPERS